MRSAVISERPDCGVVASKTDSLLTAKNGRPSCFVLRKANPGQRRTTMGHSSYDPVEQGPAWNAGKKLGAKRPLKPKEIWEIRFMLDRQHRLRDRALFDLAIDSKLRGCDLVKVRIGDLVSRGRVRNRAT